MSKGGGVGGPATLSSFRVQKAFSINFRENKRLRATIRVIEGGHMRAIRQIKQDITETKLWLKGVQENTGYSQHGIPNSERFIGSPKTPSRRQSLAASIASTDRATPRPNTKGKKIQHDAVQNAPIHEVNESAEQNVTPPQVRFIQTEQGPRRELRGRSNLPPPPSTAGPEIGSALPEQIGANRGRNGLSNGDPLAPPLTTKEDVREETAREFEQDSNQVLYGGAFEGKPRAQSATSGKSNQSLNAYQRRQLLKGMVKKKQSSLDSKKRIHLKECIRVDTKVTAFLKGFDEWMKIPIPEISKLDLEKHNTPFAKDINISS